MTDASQFHDAATVLDRMVNAFATGRTDDAREYLAEDYYDHQGLDDLPLVGPDAFSALVQVARSGYTALNVVIDASTVEGDRVSANLTWTGTHHDGSVEVRRTREIVRVANGVAVEHWGTREV